MAWMKLLVMTLPLTLPAAAGEGARVQVEVSGLKSKRGLVRCSLWNQSEGWPRQVARAHQRQSVVPRPEGTATCVFEGVRPGAYAVVFIQDENENGKLDSNLVGIPKEPFGFSRVKARFSAPAFEEASFRVESAPLTLRIEAQ